MRRSLPSSILIFVLTTVLGGCGTVEETEKLPPPPVAEVQKPPEPPVNFRTKTDTVATVTPAQQGEQSTTPRNPEIRFMVQIGAFKDAQNASRIQALARDRYHLPVLNDYNTALTLYQIRLGFFETRETAKAFRDRMAQEYPEEYKDAWVAQLTQ